MDTPTLETLLNTKDPKKQAEAVLGLINTTNAPGYVVTIVVDPRKEMPTVVARTTMGEDVPMSILGQILAMAQLSMFHQAERDRQQQVAATAAEMSHENDMRPPTA